MSIDFWDPAVRGDQGGAYERKPAVGALIAVRREPFRVLEVRDVEPVDWRDADRDLWLSEGMPDPWHRAPFVVVLLPPSGKRLHVEVHPKAWTTWWKPLPEHYAVCVQCGELAPCRDVTAERAAVREMERFSRLASILPGCCWSCREPITSRQASVTFDGENLWMPTAGQAAFHLRRRCQGGAARYEEDWVRADATRPRSLLTLTCKGTLVCHVDSWECFGAVDSSCPDLRARHAVYVACYAQSHDCPQGCSSEGHFGARGPR
jgi:hypothetical protein